MNRPFRLNPLFLAVIAAGVALPALAERQSSIQSALVYVTGNGYYRYDGNEIIREAAHYPLILGSSRFFYQRSDGSYPYVLIHQYNPATRITNYANGPHGRNDSPEKYTASLNLIARWSNSRGHPGGTLWNNHGPCATDDHWFLVKTDVSHTSTDCNDYLNASYWENASIDPFDGVTPGVTTYWLDFGSEDVREYWAEATINDLLTKTHSWPNPSAPSTQHPLDTAALNSTRLWKTNGLFIDTTSLTDVHGNPGKYDAAEWAEEMGEFIAYATETIRDEYPDQDMYFNVGGAGDLAGQPGWAYLDGLPSTSRPTGLLEEDGFAIAYGANEVQFRPVTKWLRAVNTLKSTSNLNAVFESHTELFPATGRDTGYDMVNEPVTYWGVYWYAMSSYLLGKNDVAGNSYFAFNHKGTTGGLADANYVKYPDDNDMDIGTAVADFTSQPMSATDSSPISIYKREFEKGWVFVNPNAKDSVDFVLPDLGKPIDHDTFQNPANIANVATLSLPRHRGIVILKDPLVGYWRFDEASGASASDSHEFLPGDSLGGTAYNSPTWQPTGGVVDGAIQFDGTDDYVAVAHDTDQLMTPKQLSISYWVKPDSGTTGSNKATVMQFGTYNTSGWQLWTGSGWNEFAFFAFGGSPAAQSFFKPFQSPLPTNQWTHLTVTVENKAGGNVDMYVNGQPFHHDTLDTPFVTTGSDVLYLGAHAGGTGGATYWGGKLDNVKIQRKALTPYEVAAEYRSLVADWRLDEPAYRRKAFDNHGSAHGTVYGDPTWLGAGSSGEPLGAVQFDGVDDGIVFEKNVAQLATPTQLTFNAWVQPASDLSNNVVAMYGNSYDTGWVLHAGKDDNEIGITFFDGTGSETIVVDSLTPISLSTSNWNKLTVTVDNKAGGAVQVYLNDVSLPLTSSTLAAPFALTPGSTLQLGSSLFGSWKGKVGHIQLFSRILTTAEIAQLTN
jgi:hypothetical protein